MTDYGAILASVRESINSTGAGQLSDKVNPDDVSSTLKAMIRKFLLRQELDSYDRDFVERLTEQIYNDMAGYGCITQYITDDSVEEINCNSWDNIYVVRNGSVERPREHFVSPIQCGDITRRMVRKGGQVIDGTVPICDSYIEKGVRISAIAPPVIEDSKGAAFSIRRQRLRKLTREDLIDSGVALGEELDLLVLCINHGVSVGIAGSTGSGKTSDMNYLLNRVDPVKRIFAIEDTRELDLDMLDGQRQVIYTKTRETGSDKFDVTADKLLKTALRFHPDILVPAEMRGAEAMTAQEAGRTGHTIVTGFHADNAVDAYTRIMTMCKMSGTDLTEDTLMKNIVRAYPIMCFKAQLADGSRRYMQVVEATDYREGKLEYRQLYRFVIRSVDYRDDGKAVIDGHHKSMGHISNRLALRLLENGALPEQIRQYTGPDWSPEEAYE